MKNAAVLPLVFLFGCGSSEARLGGDVILPDTDRDTSIVDTLEDTYPTDAPDTTVDPEPEIPPDTGPCPVPAPCPDGPPDGVLGRPCLGDGACDEVTAAACVGDIEEYWNGETYVEYPNGACMLWTGGGFLCSPEDDSGCPPGSHCLPSGAGYGGDMNVCIDACEPADTSGDLHGWACGCWPGYYCDLTYEVCLSGCSNDRECCETWTDLNGDYRRETGEVVLWPGCTSYCDGDDAAETADCMAGHSCINPGTPGARFGDACDHDSHCPVDGTCWGWLDPETGLEYPPGGYCIREGCQYPGRGCEDGSGACINFGSFERPGGYCVRPCHTGREITDPAYECRTAHGEEQACFPTYAMSWIGGPPPDGSDGYCFPGNFGPGSGVLGSFCNEPEDCASPLGLGECADWWPGSPFCSIRCNESLALGGICGAAGSGGVAAGICGWTMCWDGCPSPGAPLGANGCDRSTLACAPLSVFDSETWVASGASRPTGFCMPACGSDEDCEEIFGPPASCDTSSGVCS